MKLKNFSTDEEKADFLNDCEKRTSEGAILTTQNNSSPVFNHTSLDNLQIVDIICKQAEEIMGNYEEYENAEYELGT